MNRYRIVSEGVYEFHTFLEGQVFNREIWLEDIGELEVEKEAYYQGLISKQAKIEALRTIEVTTSNGNTFDGDDIARADMMSAIVASETLGQTETQWKLADNTWITVTLDEMRETSALAIQAKGLILSQ